jgi:hypothetical protein
LVVSGYLAPPYRYTFVFAALPDEKMTEGGNFLLAGRVAFFFPLPKKV